MSLTSADAVSPASFDSGFFSSCHSPSSYSPSAAPTMAPRPASSAVDARERHHLGPRPSTCRDKFSTPRLSPASSHAYRGMQRNYSDSRLAQDTTSTPPRNAPVCSLASFAAEMAVWLWFESTPKGKGKDSPGVLKTRVVPTERFLHFCHTVLTTTQLSHSAVILGLLFIARLKSQNEISGAPGSEFRLFVTALMMANKVLDDNTYTAKTWAEVSSLELGPLVAGESEFLRGLDWKLHISASEFDGWIKLLDGHVNARLSYLENLRSIRRSERLSRRQSIHQHDAAHEGVPRFSFSHASPPPVAMDNSVDVSRPVTRAFAQQMSRSQGMGMRLGKRPGSDLHDERSQKRLVPSAAWGYRSSAGPAVVAPPTPRSFGSQSPAVMTPSFYNAPPSAVLSSKPYAAGLAAPFSPFAPVPVPSDGDDETLSYYSLAAGRKQGVKHHHAPRSGPVVSTAATSVPMLPTPRYNVHYAYANSAPSYSPAGYAGGPTPPSHSVQSSPFAGMHTPMYAPASGMPMPAPLYEQPGVPWSSYANAGPPGFIWASMQPPSQHQHHFHHLHPSQVSR